MALAAIDVLSAGDRNFILLVEAGKVDWALHANNLDCAIGEVREADRAFVAVMNALRKLDPELKESAVLVTSDHGHLLRPDMDGIRRLR